MPESYIDRKSPLECLSSVVKAFTALAPRRPSSLSGPCAIPISEIRGYLDEAGLPSMRSEHFNLLLHMDAVWLEAHRDGIAGKLDSEGEDR